MFYKWSTIRRFLKYSSPIINMFEKGIIKQYAKISPVNHPAFIIGPPRSGSTILYQTLSNQLDLLYIDNLTNLSRQNLYFGFWLSNLIYNSKPHQSFSSNFGKTEKLHDPSESGQFWRQWIIHGEDYISKGEIQVKDLEQMHNMLYAVINKYQKDLLIKNLYFSQRLNLIKEIAPESKIIIIRRDTFFNAQSLLLAKRKNNYGNTMWSTRPRNFRDLEKMDDPEQVVKQIYYIEDQISKDIGMFPKNQILEVHYEHFINHPEDTIESVRTFIGPEVKYREGAMLPNLKPSEKVKVDLKEAELLNKYIKGLSWKKSLMQEGGFNE